MARTPDIPYPSAMSAATPVWPARLRAELDEADARATTLAQELAIAQLNWRPSPGAWSIGQCLDHLTITNDVYLAAMATALEEAPLHQVGDITPGWFARYFISNYMEPTAKTRKSPAPRKIRPHQEVDGAVLDRFLRSNAAARTLVGRASMHDVNRLRFRNPFVPLIRFTVGSGFAIITAHQRRHLLQAERVKEAMLAQR